MKINEVNLKFGTLVLNNKPSKIVLHHAEAAKCSVEDINAWHKNNGWAGIGYHYLIRKDGSIYRGRPEKAQGAHCPGANTNSIGICFEGSYIKETMAVAQYNSGIELINDIRGRYGEMPIYGHKDLYSTDCPGSNFPLEDFRSLKKINEVSKVNDYTITYTEVYNDNNASKVIGSLEKGKDVVVIDYWSTLSKIKYGDSFAYVESCCLNSRSKNIIFSEDRDIFADGNLKEKIGVLRKGESAPVLAEYANAYKIAYKNDWRYILKIKHRADDELVKENEDLKAKLDKIKGLVV